MKKYFKKSTCFVLMNKNNNTINKGTGAGGAKTNYNGLSFEDKTSIEPKLNEVSK